MAFVSAFVWVALCVSVGFVSSFFTQSSVDTWYQTLNQPSFRPPDGVFAPVWTTLYVMMGIAAWLVWRERERQAINGAMVFFAVQLALNFAWSGIFFGLRRPDWAFAEIILLWLAIVATIFAFRRITSLSAVLLIPYLLWVSFASVLNAAFWILNRS